MDTAKLELAAQRRRDALAALEAADNDLKAETVAALLQAKRDGERGAQVEAARITGWTRETLRKLVRDAEA